MQIISTSLSKRVFTFASSLSLGVGLFVLPSLSVTALAQNTTTDLIGNLLSSSTPKALEVTWSPTVSDSIGRLITDIKKQSILQQAEKLSSTPNSLGESESSSPLQDFVNGALRYKGVRYRYGGATPSGFDCSGLVYYTANKYMGVKLPRTASSMVHVGTSVKRSNLQAGDLVFFNTRGFRNSHVGIYLGDNKFLHAPRSGKDVRIEHINSYWSKRYNGARRLPNAQPLAKAK